VESSRTSGVDRRVLRVRYAGDPSPVLDDVRMPGARWFPNLELIYAEHVFCGRERDPPQVAVRHRAEDGQLSEITWGRAPTSRSRD
jgi:acetoacetyl-CoA synthetase